ncbi:MAG: hypothetical protein GWM98_29245, partial [Nitrospinaceae bacterium]|nr:hypothetical protein [Nitrospinaceae bacterium]NIR57794.1 hypothetical protein [Nitrospinaceae bacterium]NIS88253.1 hypothetical protein [Nitrospinaceae bacterium]NIT85134.1 hypothetical protein [Nitrospinaceae bacterium]NIU47290.1 hypothetical protein [Nitrospinaceae bacterium]
MPLLSVVEDSQVQEDLKKVARQSNQEWVQERGMDVEAQVLEIIRDLIERE